MTKKLTPAQLAALTAIEEGKVSYADLLGSYHLRTPTGNGRTLAYKMMESLRGGGYFWLDRGKHVTDRPTMGLTDLGRAALPGTDKENPA